MEASTLLDKLRDEGVPTEPVYVLHGPERFLVDQVVARLRERVVSGLAGDFNFQRMMGSEVSGAEIAAAARELPMMSGMRMVLVEEGQKLGAKDLEALDKYLANPEPLTCLVLVADSFDLRRGPISKANRRGQVHKAEQIKERNIGAFLNAMAGTRNVTFGRGASEAIAAAIGPDLTALNDAVERLALYAGGDGEITEESVGEVVTAVRQRSVFELVDAIGDRKPERALSLARSLLSAREEPLRINSMLARHVRQLLAMRAHLHLKTPQNELASAVGAPPFVVRKLAAQARRFRGAELERALARLSLADVELKSSRRPGGMIIEEVVLDLCNGPAA